MTYQADKFTRTYIKIQIGKDLGLRSRLSVKRSTQIDCFDYLFSGEPESVCSLVLFACLLDSHFTPHMKLRPQTRPRQCLSTYQPLHKENCRMTCDREVVPLVPHEITIPVPPTSISAATMTNQAIPIEIRMPVTIVGAAAGKMTVSAVFKRPT